MEAPVLKIYVSDTVAVHEGTRTRKPRREVRSRFFQPGFVLRMDKDVEWAPSRSRAPSITIDFELLEAMDF